MNVRWLVAPLVALLLVLAISPGAAGACGGFFCSGVPADQAAERIVFTMDDGTITTYVQINYTGSADEFAWILPMPAVPKVDTADMTMFRDLDRLTQPVYIGPRPPDCLQRRMPIPAAAPAGVARSDGSGTTVLASGEVGPFGYHVVTSPDPMDLVQWLRDNKYHIEDEMIPLVKQYTDDGMVFLAMKLKPGKQTTDITPVKLMYDARLPTIPLRLTAVAATPDMPVIVWIFAKDQTQSLNYTPITIADSEVKFSPFGGNDYRQTVVRAVDQAGGHAFVTELAQPTSALRPPSDPNVTLLFQQYPYLTRHYTRISPEEMTIDPSFDMVPGLPNVSNVHDLSNRPAPWVCSDDPNTFKPVAGSGPPPWMMAGGRYLNRLGQGGAPKGWAMFAIVGLTAAALVWRGRAMLHSQAGLSTDSETTPGVRIPYGSEPDPVTHIRALAPHHKYYPSGISEILTLEETVKGNPQAVLQLCKAAFASGFREFTANVANNDLVRVTGYMIRLSDVKRHNELKVSRTNTTALGAEAAIKERWERIRRLVRGEGPGREGSKG